MEKLTKSFCSSHLWSSAYKQIRYSIDGLVKDCGNSTVLAMELLLSCAQPSVWYLFVHVFERLGYIFCDFDFDNDQIL